MVISSHNTWQFPLNCGNFFPPYRNLEKQTALTLWQRYLSLYIMPIVSNGTYTEWNIRITLRAIMQIEIGQVCTMRPINNCSLNGVTGETNFITSINHI